MYKFKDLTGQAFGRLTVIDKSTKRLKSNVLVCCDRCNKGKSNLFTYEEWYKMTEPFRNGELPINEQGISEISGSVGEASDSKQE